MDEITKAKIQAIEEQIDVPFDTRRESEKNQWTGLYGIAKPCGCLDFTTVLPDGSLGHTKWTDPCEIHKVIE